MGYNYRIDEIRSAIGREQLKKLPAGNARREVLVERYRKAFTEQAPALGLPFSEKRGVSSKHIFPVLLPERVDREAFREKMKADGIQTSFHYPPVHHFKIYRQEGDELWMTENVARRQVTLPLFPSMTDEQQDWVIERVVDALN